MSIKAWSVCINDDVKYRRAQLNMLLAVLQKLKFRMQRDRYETCLGDVSAGKILDIRHFFSLNCQSQPMVESCN